MELTFPGESAQYRIARNRFLEKELGLRRQMEAVAAARRALPPGGLVPEDYAWPSAAGGETSRFPLTAAPCPSRTALLDRLAREGRKEDGDEQLQYPATLHCEHC